MRRVIKGIMNIHAVTRKSKIPYSDVVKIDV
jgi:hypothetical protein